MKNEMQALTMRISKEIEDQKMNEENLGRSLKNRSEECIQLAHENDALRTKLVQSQSNEQELERQMIILRDNLTIANEYKDKFKVSLAQLNELLESQRQNKDSRGLGFEQCQSFGIANEDQDNRNQRTPIRYLNA